ncbi:MAG: hypothetical protein Kow0077_27760 [Anaerolineae bacterium]
MDLTRSFSYIFDDEDWASKVVLMAIISIIPILNLAVYGWLIELMRNMLHGYDTPMPDWSNFGEKFGAGLAYVVAAFIYNLVAIVFMIPIIAVGALTENTAMEALGVALACILSVFIIAYLVVANAGLLIGMIRYALNPVMASYLDIGENLRIALRHAGTLLTMVLFMLLVAIIFSVLGMIPCIGWLIALALGTPVYAHLIGQAAIMIVGREKRKRAAA